MDYPCVSSFSQSTFYKDRLAGNDGCDLRRDGWSHPDVDILQHPIVPTDFLKANKTFIDHESQWELDLTWCDHVWPDMKSIWKIWRGVKWIWYLPFQVLCPAMRPSRRCTLCRLCHRLHRYTQHSATLRTSLHVHTSEQIGAHTLHISALPLYSLVHRCSFPPRWPSTPVPATNVTSDSLGKSPKQRGIIMPKLPPRERNLEQGTIPSRPRWTSCKPWSKGGLKWSKMLAITLVVASVLVSRT